MKISPDQVDKIAKLSRLDLDQKQKELFTSQLDSILEYVDKLSELDTSNTEPLYSPVDQVSILREDEPCQEYTRKQILDNSPGNSEEFFVVPKIVS